MKVIIVGCGRMGRGLALELDRKNHEVTVIDTDPNAIKMLGDDFKGKKMIGIGFDKTVLETARITHVDAIVASTASDETNALIARIARNIYKVPRVIARLYDIRKAVIYNALGIQTISTTHWGVQRAKELLSYSQLDTIMDLGNNSVEIIRVEVPPLMEGRRLWDLIRVGEVDVVAVGRGSKAFLPVEGTLLEKDDVLYIAVLSSALGKLKTALGL